MMQPWIIFMFIGFCSGVAAGLFGIGGGVLIIPALMYWAGFSQHLATGTTLAVLLPPIGLAAAMEYYRHGNVNIFAAAILAATMFPSSWVGAYFANHMEGAQLRLIFGLFVCALGIYLVYGACKRLCWI